MPQDTVLIVGGRPETVRKAADLGLRVVYLQQKHQFGTEHASAVEAALLTDFTNWSAVRPLVAAAAAAFAITGVATLTEPGLETIGRIAALLGLPADGHEAHRLLRDKALMRRHLARVGADSLAAAVVTDRESLSAFGREHGYPFILKPVDGVASLGVMRVEDAHAVDDAWEHILRIRSTDFPPYSFDRFLMEQYVDGPEYSVESFTFDGRHVVLAITEKITLDNHMEFGHAMPARLDPETEHAIVDSVVAFLDAVGVQQGPTHTEVRIPSTGVARVIESHTRTGGDRIVELIEAAYGVDQERLALAWPFGLSPALTDRPRPRCAAATRFVSAEPGTVVAVDGVEQVLAHPDLLMLDLPVAVGDTVRPLVRYQDRPGQVLVTAATTEAAIRTCEELAATIRIRTR